MVNIVHTRHVKHTWVCSEQTVFILDYALAVHLGDVINLVGNCFQESICVYHQLYLLHSTDLIWDIVCRFNTPELLHGSNCRV